MIEPTEAEQATRCYAAAMDSVNLISGPKPQTATDAEWVDTLKRNKDHLLIQIKKTKFYAGKDLTPLKLAAATAVLPTL